MAVYDDHNLPNIMKISNYDQIFGPKTVDDSVTGKTHTLAAPKKFSFGVNNINQKYNYNRPYNMRDVAGEVGEYGGNEFTQYTKENLNPQGIEGTTVAQNQGGNGFNLMDFFPGKAIYETLGGMLPKMDPRQVALRDHYKIDDIGRVRQGELMAGYNTVSGGGLNTLTGGKFGAEPTYGLQKAYDKRLSTIDKTLAKWESDEEKYGERLKTTQLYARRKALQKAKADELAMLNKVTGNQGGTTITDTNNQGGGYDPNVHGGTDYGKGSQGQQSYSNEALGGQDLGFGVGATSGVPVSNRTGRGRQDWALGGRIGYREAGPVLDENVDENIFEFMQDQGVPHSEMAEKSPFEMRIDELMDEGMSWQEAYDIASDEFNQLVEGGGDSFSEEGIASIV